MMIRLTINGKGVMANSRNNLLEIIQQQGIQVPSLCHFPGHEKRSVCRLCMIEVEGIPHPVSACSTPISDGMVILTETSLLIQLRRTLIKMALLEHGSCEDANCRIENLARALNVNIPEHNSSVYTSCENSTFSDYFEVYPDYCIHCDRCIRACTKNIINRAGRGAQTTFVFGQGQGLEEAGCVYCGDCTRACPSNALKVTT